MKKTITIAELIDQIQAYLDGKHDYDAVRNYVYSRYESEDDILVADDADEVLSVLSPYVETEEAIPDQKRKLRLRRLVTLLEEPRGLPPAAVAVYALKFDEISELTNRRDKGTISEQVYLTQLSKLTPADLDVKLIVEWARQQKGDSEPMANKIGDGRN